MHKILFISPGAGTTELAQSIIPSFDELDFEILNPKSWSERVQLSEIEKKIKGNDYSGICAYGEICRELSERCSVPVFEIQISDADILAAVSLGIKYTGECILIVNRYQEKHVEYLLRLLNLPVKTYSAVENENFSETISQLGSQYSLLIGDALVYSICQARELNCLLLSPGYDTIQLLIQQISRIFRQQDQLHLTNGLFKQYFGSIGGSFLIFDSEHRLVNHMNMENRHKLQNIAESLIETVIQKKRLLQMRTVSSKTYFLKGTLISYNHKDYIVFEIKQSFEDKVITAIPGVILKNQENISKNFYNMFYNHLKNSDFRNQVIAYSATHNPVVIIGESGTGKSRLADFIYTHSPYKQSSLFLIDCKQLDKRGLHLLFESEQSPLYEYGITLYFKEINLLKRKYTDELVNFLMQSAFMKKNKVVFSVTCGVKESGENRLCQQLISKLNAFPLYLSPLRERADDIPNLCVLYLNQLNETYHKHIAGFEPEALNYLQSFYWDENIKQFKRVLEELFTITSTPYISARNVILVLRERKGEPPAVSVEQQVPLTLNQIIQNGVRKALIANNMNHTKTAQELGISRTALWRLLKKA